MPRSYTLIIISSMSVNSARTGRTICGGYRRSPRSRQRAALILTFNAISFLTRGRRFLSTLLTLLRLSPFPLLSCPPFFLFKDSSRLLSRLDMALSQPWYQTGEEQDEPLLYAVKPVENRIGVATVLLGKKAASCFFWCRHGWLLLSTTPRRRTMLGILTLVLSLCVPCLFRGLPWLLWWSIRYVGRPNQIIKVSSCSLECIGEGVLSR